MSKSDCDAAGNEQSRHGEIDNETERNREGTCFPHSAGRGSLAEANVAANRIYNRMDPQPQGEPGGFAIPPTGSGWPISREEIENSNVCTSVRAAFTEDNLCTDFESGNDKNIKSHYATQHPPVVKSDKRGNAPMASGLPPGNNKNKRVAEDIDFACCYYVFLWGNVPVRWDCIFVAIGRAVAIK